MHDYTQAIMDLGATVCVPRKPLCGQCPLAELCEARQLGLEAELPVKQPGKQVPERHEAALLIEHAGRYLVRRRPAAGFLGGLWEFPAVSLEADENPTGKLRTLLSELGLQSSGEIRKVGNIRHVYSHFRLQSVVCRVRVADRLRLAEGPNRWLAPQDLAELALHGAHKKALECLIENGA